MSFLPSDCMSFSGSWASFWGLATLTNKDLFCSLCLRFSKPTPSPSSLSWLNRIGKWKTQAGVKAVFYQNLPHENMRQRNLKFLCYVACDEIQLQWVQEQADTVRMSRAVRKCYYRKQGGLWGHHIYFICLSQLSHVAWNKLQQELLDCRHQHVPWLSQENVF